MFKKIILTFALLIFAQQEFYGSDYEIEEEEIEEEKENNNGNPEEKKQKEFWEKWNIYCNYDYNDEKDKSPKLWWLWAITDNVPIQYGNSKVWEHGEAYYGLSNGIGIFPSISNFGWLKIGFVDFHINVINLILIGLKYFVGRMYDSPKKYSVRSNILYSLCYNIVTGIHLFSFNFLNCVKIKIISIGIVIVALLGLIETEDENSCKNWYYVYNCENFGKNEKISSVYLLLSPRIEINISEIINYFKGEVSLPL